MRGSMCYCRERAVFRLRGYRLRRLRELRVRHFWLLPDYTDAETVIITSSSDEKLAQAKELGADYTINYRTNPDWEKTVMEVTNNHGADIVLETGGAKTLKKSFDCIAFGGLIDCIGYLSGKVDEPEDRTNVNVLALRRNVTLKGIINGPKDRFEEMIKFYEKHQIRPVVNRVFSFDEAKEAFNFLYSGSHFGKVVITV